MKRVLAYVFSYKKATTIALSLMLFELMVELVQPIIMARIIDEGVVKQDLSMVMTWGSVLLGLSLLAFVGGIVSSFFAAEVSQGVGYDVRRDVYTKIQTFSTIRFQKFSTSSLIMRLTNDVTQIQGFVFMGLRIMLRAPLFIVFGVAMAFSIHAGLPTILAIAVPTSIVVMLFIVSKGVLYFTKVQEKLDSVNSVIQENLVGIRLIKAFNRGGYEEERFNKENQSLQAFNVKALRFMELAMPIIMLGMNSSLVIMLWFGALELNVGDAQPGEVVALINYGTRILGSIGMFAFLMMNFTRGRASAHRIDEVLREGEDEEWSRKDKNRQPVEGAVDFQNVSFYYDSSSTPALRNVTFHVNPGETLGILGETGSGKSSLIQLIPRLFEPTSGEIFIDGKNMKDIEIDSLRLAIGLVPQEAHLFTGTIRDNILWGNERATMDDIIQAAKAANIHDFIMTLPEAYETKIGQRGVNLSGGQKQRLSLARAIVRRPKILLLDDSTSALDANTEASVLQALKQMRSTTFIIAQKISSVADADKILLLNQGRVVASGSHDELFEQNALYQSIYYSQVQEDVLQYDE